MFKVLESVHAILLRISRPSKPEHIISLHGSLVTAVAKNRRSQHHPFHYRSPRVVGFKIVHFRSEDELHAAAGLSTVVGFICLCLFLSFKFILI